MKLVLVTNIYAPYREPVWNVLATMVDELHVVLMRESESNRLWGMGYERRQYKIHILGSKGSFCGGWLDSELYLGGGIWQLLNKVKPTRLILAGYTAGPFIEAMIWAKMRKIPFGQWYESHTYSSHFKGGAISFLRRLLLGLADAWCVPGLMSKAYLEEMGIPSDKITIAPNTVDVHKIRSLLISQYPPDNYEHRSGPARIFYIGQYLKRKRVDLLLDAYSELPPDGAVLRLVGYGPLEDELRKRAVELKGVEFLSATRTLEETMQHYSWADIVVMPSDREVWGLVVNEALAAGCYVLSSSLAGVTPDLVENAPLDVGKVINPLAGAAALTNVLSATIDDIAKIRKRRAAIVQWGQNFTPELTAKGLFEALESINN